MSQAAYSPSRWQASVWLLESRFQGHKTESALLITNMGAVCPAPQELCPQHKVKHQGQNQSALPACDPRQLLPGRGSPGHLGDKGCLPILMDKLSAGTTSTSRLGWCEVSQLAGSPAPTHPRSPLVPPSCSLPAWAPSPARLVFCMSCCTIAISLVQ